ncbi:4376_t:CDS:2 [Diversispora eburnea]|uniref:4376_t:CDS:1 n=1 Tax=Diversispora eburnea TaxID=1213867 RepID=A0A9N8YPW7_9GLOM|nr:4376_t:CDS:2 [Diversispora eburnea]
MEKNSDKTINIVVLCDGTLNGPVIETNVYKLHLLLLSYYEAGKTRRIPGIDSLRFEKLKDRNLKYRKTHEIAHDAFLHKDHYYESGVGGKFNVIDSMVAYNIDDKIKRAYRHIVRRRGAYTVRCVAGMIRNCGILRYDSKELINRAYDLYRSKDPNHSPKEQESESFRKSFSHPGSTIIKFLGLWDTVGAQGLPTLTIGKGFEYLKLHDNNVSKMVKNVYQVLSIHEKSVFFEPISRKNEDYEKCEECKKNEKCKNNEKCECIKLEEIWFPGDHLEVGGGIFSVDDGISNESLRWMIRKILCTGGLLSDERLKGESLLEKKLEECLNQIEKIPKSLFASLTQRVLPLVSVYRIKRATTILPLLHRNRIIPLYRNDKGMLTFDLLYKKGYWENKKGYWKNTKFKNIKDVKKHKHKRLDSLTEFYDAMEDILIEELKRTSSGSASDAKDANGKVTKAKHQEQNIKEIIEIYEEIEIDKMKNNHEIYRKNNDEEIDKKDKEKIWKLFKEIGKNRIGNIESFDAKTISNFNIERLIHRYNARVNKDFCQKCNSRDLLTKK